MKLTNEQIEQVLNDAPELATHFCSNNQYWKLGCIEETQLSFEQHQSQHDFFEGVPIFINDIKSLDNLREILSLRKELEQTKKELEAVINEESDGVNGVV